MENRDNVNEMPGKFFVLNWQIIQCGFSWQCFLFNVINVEDYGMDLCAENLFRFASLLNGMKFV